MRFLRRLATPVAAGAICAGAIAVTAFAASAGPAGATSPTYRIVQKTMVVDTNRAKAVDIPCPSGYTPIGGGGHVGNGEFSAVSATNVGISASDVDLSHRGWEVVAYVNSPQANTSFTADAVCAVG